MPGHLEELKGLAREFVGPAEAIHSAADVNYGGKVNLNQVTTGTASVLGHQEAKTAAGEALARRLGDEPFVLFPSAPQMALVLTDTRLVIWSRGGWKGTPKAFLGEVPLTAVDRAVCEHRQHGDRLTITMRSGWEITLDVTDEDTGEHTFGPALMAAIPERGEPDDDQPAAGAVDPPGAPGPPAGDAAPAGELGAALDADASSAPEAAAEPGAAPEG